jgi:hypothetical protein
MPGFIKNPADEKKWNAIKHSVAKQRGKSTEDFTDRDWATVNAAWHKSEYEEIMKSIFISASSGMASSEKTSVSLPKPKRFPGPGSKASVFFKREEFGGIKKTSIENLRAFLEKAAHKRQS